MRTLDRAYRRPTGRYAVPLLLAVLLSVAMATAGCGTLIGGPVATATGTRVSSTTAPDPLNLGQTETLSTDGTEDVPGSHILDVPLLRQADPRWMNVPMAGDGPPIGDEGCALTSFAMVASYYGFPATPAQANETMGAYAYPVEWVAGEPRYGMHIVRKDSIRFRDARLHDAEYVRDTIEDCIRADWPVILGVLQTSTGATHFIVAYGLEVENPEKTRILVRDPSGVSNYTYWDDLPDGWIVTRLVVFEK